MTEVVMRRVSYFLRTLQLLESLPGDIILNSLPKDRETYPVISSPSPKIFAAP